MKKMTANDVRIESVSTGVTYLEAMRLGESHIELKIEIMKRARDGSFVSRVYRKECFLLESALLTKRVPAREKKGMVELFVEDDFYDTTAVQERTHARALRKTLDLVWERLKNTGGSIELISDLPAIPN